MSSAHPIRLSCCLAPSADTTRLIRIAEEAGYQRAWLYDSPSLYEDVWMHLTLAATVTERIALGPGVLVPSLRHVAVTASAAQTLERLAPGRVVIAVGTGYTGRMAMGQPPARWAEVVDYVDTLRRLLAGEIVSVDGGHVRMMHAGERTTPATIPILVAANGPKGWELARQHGDGLMTSPTPQAGFEECALVAFGTILGDDEEPGDPRVVEALTPMITPMLQVAFDSGNIEMIQALPGGEKWRRAIEAIAPELRHLALYGGPAAGLGEIETPAVDPRMLAAGSWTARGAELKARVEEAVAQGMTELVFAPTTPDPADDLVRFAEAVLS